MGTASTKKIIKQVAGALTEEAALTTSAGAGDADLGIRLTRFGYETATLSLPTLEEAPVTLAPWMRQRARWFKGWLRPVNEYLYTCAINSLVHI